MPDPQWLRQADRIAQMKTAWDAWNTGTGEERAAMMAATRLKTGNLKSSVATQEGYLRPFKAVKATTWVKTKILVGPGETSTDSESASGQITQLKAATAKYNTVTKPIAANDSIFSLIGLRGQNPARIIYTKVGAKIPGVVSRRTKEPYSYRKSDSVSTPFGRTVETFDEAETPDAIFDLIKNDLKAAAGEDKVRVYYKQEEKLNLE
ncbi:MAG TPA: hypothetical protein V6D21_16535 [Candidatus Obscuribacterales bacterium]